MDFGKIQRRDKKTATDGTTNTNNSEKNKVSGVRAQNNEWTALKLKNGKNKVRGSRK